jgi:anti-anti-sigma regulatory factor
VTDPGLDPIWIDVGQVLQRTVTSLYSHLVTRPTGRAVRMAIETQLQAAGERSLSLIDLSEVVIIDFSCADEVVAQLLEGSRQSRSHEAFFVFRGVHEPHRDQIETVLERRGLAAVAETAPDTYQLLGRRSDFEERTWCEIERRGVIAPGEIDALLSDRAALESLLERRLALRSAVSGRIHALSRLVRHLH